MKEIQHNLEGSTLEILTNTSLKWTDFLTDKLEQKDLRYLLQKDKFAKLIGITFEGMTWLDNPQEIENPEYIIMLGKNDYNFREIVGNWRKEAYLLLSEHRYEYSHPSEQELLMEMFEEFKMDEVLTKLSQKNLQY